MKNKCLTLFKKQIKSFGSVVESRLLLETVDKLNDPGINSVKHLLKNPNDTELIDFRQSINRALDRILEKNDHSMIFGEDVGFNGVFFVSEGLQKKYGKDRVFSTPLCEQGIAGFGIGVAAHGGVCVAEIQFADYIFPAFDQIVNEAAKYRYRSGNEHNVGGLIIRSPYGSVGHGGLYHSQSPEAYFSHTPGLTIVMPRSPIQAKGLLLSAAKSKNPVLFFESKRLYQLAKENVPKEDYEIELSKAEVVRKGKDITLIGWGAQTRVCQSAAHMASEAGIDVEVIDLRTVYPWDKETVIESVKKTGKAIITHEAPISSGLGAEISSVIQEKCFIHLSSPISRVCGYDTPFPHLQEPLYLPNRHKIFEAIKESMKWDI